MRLRYANLLLFYLICDGFLHDKLGDKTKGKSVFVIDGGAICKITDDGVNKKHSNNIIESISDNKILCESISWM